MKYIFSLALLACTIQGAFASYDQAPPQFSYKNGKVAYVDFKSASYKITFDRDQQAAEVESIIPFYSSQSGFPLFDLIPDPSSVTIDGAVVTTEVIQDPDKESFLRVIQSPITPGAHVLRVKHTLKTNVVVSPEGVAAGFWISDLTDRKYLEQYLPTNLEYDQYKIVMDVKVVGTPGQPHFLKANGKVQEIGENTFRVLFPDFYSTSSVYFHLFPKNNTFRTTQFVYLSMDGRRIPVDIYTIYDANEFAAQTRVILDELEKDYGPFPHNQIVIYGNAPSGGMEHSGATITSLKALGHELFHSYHARALMPANGNAGWMDEAIARWRDNSYPMLEKLSYESTQLAGHSVWSRKTDRMAYTEGSQFLSWLAFRMNEKGGSFKVFLKEYFQKYRYTTVTTELFRDEIGFYSGLAVVNDFNKYIYGKGTSFKNFDRDNYVVDELALEGEDPHPRYTKEQLKQMTWPQ